MSCILCTNNSYAQTASAKFPFADLPNDSATQTLQALYEASSLVSHAKSDSLYARVQQLPESISLRQACVRNYLTARYFSIAELYDQATKIYATTKQTAMDNNWPDVAVHCALGLASIEYYLGNRMLAYQKWQELSGTYPPSCWYLEAVANSNLGAVAYERWKFEADEAPNHPLVDTVQTYYQAALQPLEAHKDLATLSRVYSLYAMFKLALKEQDEAYALLKKATDAAIESDNYHQFNFNRINWAKYLIVTGEYDAAIDSVSAAYAFFEAGGVRNQQYHAGSILVSVHEAAGNFELSASLLRDLAALKDSMDLDQMRRQAYLYRTQLEVYEQRLQLEQQSKQLLNEQAENEKLETDKNRLIMLMTGSIIILLLVAGLIIQFIRQRARNEQNLLLIQERENALDAVLNAQEVERKRIAQELHDGVGQQLSGIKMALQHISETITDGNSTLRERMHGLIQVVKSSSQEVRQLAHQMLPQVLESRGLLPALEDLLQQAYHQTGIKFVFESGLPGDKRYAPAVELAVYRALQETVNNTIKHSNATEVDVHIYELNNQLIAMYSDNGIGFDPETASKGLGITGIRNRIAHLNGSFAIDSAPNSGFSCTLRLPVDAQ